MIRLDIREAIILQDDQNIKEDKYFVVLKTILYDNKLEHIITNIVKGIGDIRNNIRDFEVMIDTLLSGNSAYRFIKFKVRNGRLVEGSTQIVDRGSVPERYFELSTDVLKSNPYLLGRTLLTDNQVNMIENGVAIK